MTVDIRRLGPADARLLERLAEDVFDDAIDRRRLAAYLAAPGHLMVLALDAEGVVVGQARGIVHLHPDQPDELYIDNMGVAPPRQREGIGGRLLDELLAWGRELGCENAWLGTETDNTAAKALYESRGAGGEVMQFYEWELEAPAT